MTKRYYRCDWEHPGSSDPAWIIYEVDLQDDVVPRKIEGFKNGAVKCTTVADFADRPNELPGFNSLVEGSFLEAAGAVKLGVPEQVGRDTTTVGPATKVEFDVLWDAHRK